MPQTLLALLALALAAFLTLNQQQVTVRTQQNMTSDEIEMAAAGLASEVLAMVDGRSFDEASTPSAIAADRGQIPGLPSDFSGGGTFGASDRGGAGCDLQKPSRTPACDDIDDLHGLDWQPASILLAREFVLDPETREPIPNSRRERSLDFEIRTQVYYVSDPTSMTASASPTRHKRVLIDIRSPLVPQASDGIYRATRVISYDPIKAAMDYENSSYYDPTYGATDETGTTVVQN